MAKLVTFGEIIMQLSPPGKKRLRQTSNLDIFFGGSEANVSAAIAAWGLPSAHVTLFPANELAKVAAGFFVEFGVDIKHCIYSGDRLGLYFVEDGAMARSPHVIYDRSHSAFSTIEEHTFNWEEILEGATWFHWTGITPAISAGAANCLHQALAVANRKGLTVSADINYRSNLWKYGRSPGEVMPPLIAQSHIIIASQYDAKNSCTISVQGEEDAFVSVSRQLSERFPGVQIVLTTERKQISASQNKLHGKMWHREELYETPVYELESIIERIGSGDAFIAGFIYARMQKQEWQNCLQLGIASSVIKHSIKGDINCCRMEDIERVANGDVGGRLKR